MIKKLTCVTWLAGAMLLAAQTAGPKTFSTPEEASAGLVQAAAGGMEALRAFLGPNSGAILKSGDEVQDKNQLELFNKRLAEKTKLEPNQMNPNQITLLVGTEEWPFAVPLMRKSGRWAFDINEGKAEIRNRAIGANELAVIDVCRGYVEAQQMYAEKDWDGNGVLEYAQKIVSTKGKKDGLFWPGEDSPVAENFAKAAEKGYGLPGNQQGYHGYFYKVLLSQGADALDGAQDYVAHGLMIGGFALVAWPVEYGVSGIMTFIVNQEGVVYEKDLGVQTGVTAKAMSKYNPDKSWRVSAW